MDGLEPAGIRAAIQFPSGRSAAAVNAALEIADPLPAVPINLADVVASLAVESLLTLARQTSLLVGSSKKTPRVAVQVEERPNRLESAGGSNT